MFEGLNYQKHSANFNIYNCDIKKLVYIKGYLYGKEANMNTVDMILSKIAICLLGTH